MYRLNFGNGQVSNTFKTRQLAERELATQTQYLSFIRIERYIGDGEWATVRKGAR